MNQYQFFINVKSMFLRRLKRLVFLESLRDFAQKNPQCKSVWRRNDNACWFFNNSKRHSVVLFHFIFLDEKYKICPVHQ